MRQDQKGFSLIELIVVIAIMGVLTGTVALLSFSTVSRQNVRNCVSEIEAQLDQTKTYAMSRKQALIYLWSDSNGVYAQMAVTNNAAGAALENEPLRTVGKSGIKLTYKDSAGNIHNTSSADKLMLTFDRSSGAFEKDAATGLYCSEIILESGNHKFILKLVPQTGKYYIE